MTRERRTSFGLSLLRPEIMPSFKSGRDQKFSRKSQAGQLSSPPPEVIKENFQNDDLAFNFDEREPQNHFPLPGHAFIVIPA